MESEESPLDVLSRAATMVSPPAYDEAKSYSGKEMASAKWRRERRQATSNKIMEAPLDFSTRHANLKPNAKPPPSYDQSMQNKMSRPSVIRSVCAISPAARNASGATCDFGVAGKSTRSADDACDPAIDEHFRRSLGKDYSSIFSKDSKELNKSENSESDSTGLTVDDHFAKALGDTWIKLKEKENEEKMSSTVKSNNNNNLGRVKDLSNGQTDVNMKKKKKSSKESNVLNEKRRAVATST